MSPLSCPQCQTARTDPAHQFCTACGLALRQPCPHCSTSLDTPAAPFVTCSSCERNFWSCRACGRLYHLDRTSCQNGYCPEQGSFWTTRFGSDEYHQSPQERSLPLEGFTADSLRPAWTGGTTAASDIRWPSLHTLGLILSVQESGVVELWAERGAPQEAEGSDFHETSVCLTRLDLGEEAPCPPFHWAGRFHIPGSQTLSVLDMSSSPSIGHRIDLRAVGRPKHFAPLGERLLVWGENGLAHLGGDGELQEESDLKPDGSTFLLSDGRSKVLLASGLELQLLALEQEPVTPDLPLNEPIEYGLHAERFVLISGKSFAYLEGSEFKVAELPGLVVAQPIYSPHTGRIILMLNDGSVRSCSTTGDRFSFVCELAGIPTTEPLKLGEKVFYGTEGRYLCCDEEAIRPRLSSPPMGALSYANRRIFGNLRDGSMFCFEL